jgi:hypothetical protein
MHETEIARFFRVFHEVYPHALSRTRKKAIWILARQVFDGDISIDQALAQSGIPAIVHEGDIKSTDDKLRLFFALLFALAMMLAYGAGAGSGLKPTQTGKKNTDPRQRVFSQLFQELEENEEPEEWIDVIGEPVPVLAPREKPEPSKAKSSQRPKRNQSETSAAPKPKQGAKAKSAAKSKKRS